MKKMIRILTIALLCMIIAMPAFAAPTLYRENLPYTRFVTGTNLLRDFASFGRDIFEKSY